MENPIRSSKSEVLNPGFRKAGDDDPAAGRAGTQGGWYEFASEFIAGQSVLDVGCGLGKGLDVLARVAQRAEGIDMDARLERPGIRKLDIADVPTKSYDSIVCIDVIEHVEDDHSFVDQLGRVARHQILLSTPNYTASRCQWPYHVREYMPDALVDLFRPFGRVTLYKGPQYGDRRHLVTHPGAYFLLNRLRVHPITGFVTRVYNRFLLPDPARIQSHSFIRVELKDS